MSAFVHIPDREYGSPGVFVRKSAIGAFRSWPTRGELFLVIHGSDRTFRGLTSEELAAIVAEIQEE